MVRKATIPVEKATSRESLRSLIRHWENKEHNCQSTHSFEPIGCTHVSIDIDETIAEVHEVMLRNYNRVKGTNYTIADHKDWDFKSVGSNYLEMMKFYVDAWKNHWEEIRFMGNKYSLIRVEEYFTQDVSSSRDWNERDGPTGGTIEGTEKWLFANGINWLPYFFDQTKIKKFDLKYEIYVDDSPKLAEEIISRSRRFQFVIDKPYNRHIPDTERTMRVSGIDEFSEELISAAIDVGIGKRHYQGRVAQRFLYEGGIPARDKIIQQERGFILPEPRN